MSRGFTASRMLLTSKLGAGEYFIPVPFVCALPCAGWLVIYMVNLPVIRHLIQGP